MDTNTATAKTLPALPDKPLKKYSVHMSFKHPAWNERDGWAYNDIWARSKSEACAEARRIADRNGETGVRWYKATEVEE